jgi:glycosyl transferase family 25
LTCEIAVQEKGMKLVDSDKAFERQPSLPPIWVINLVRFPERKHFMTQQLEVLGLRFEIIVAIDGISLHENDRAKYSKALALQIAGRALSENEIACALTHAMLYHRIVEQNIEQVLILEDDVYLSNAMIEIISRSGLFLHDWDVLNFATDAAKTPVSSQPLFENYALCRFNEHANRTSAYLITSAGARKLLDHIYPIRLAADGILGRTDITGIKAYGIAPRVVRLAEFKSDIWDYPGQWRELEHATPATNQDNSACFFTNTLRILARTKRHMKEALANVTRKA